MHGRSLAAVRRLARLLVVAAPMLAVAAPGTAAAAELAVTSREDSRVCDATRCTLRGALVAAAAGDAIRVPAGNYQLTLGPLRAVRDITVIGAGAGRTVIRATAGRRTLLVGDGEGAAPAVTLSHLELAGGYERYDRGGNILNQGALTLDHVRVRGGEASAGGGVASVGAARLVVTRSLIDGNIATGVEWYGQGGGIYSDAHVNDALVIRDSTLTGNRAESGAGVALGPSGDVPVARAARLERVTIARNHAVGATPGGLRIGDATRVVLAASILAVNTAKIATRSRGVRAPVPSNCGGEPPADQGANLADHDDCGFGAEADPQLSDALVGGLGPTPVLTIAPTSPAVDRAGACAGTDQRDVVRPQGDACDAGAFEVAAPVIASGPDGGASPSFAFSSDHGTTEFECRLDGPGGPGAWEPCASPRRYSLLAAGDYVFAVRATGSSAQAVRAFTVPATPPTVQPRPRPQPQPPPQPTPAPPQPEYRRSVVVKPTSGTVKVRRPGTKTYVGLTTLDGVPLGSSIDARRGRVRLYAIARRGARPQAASFYGGVFRVVQRGPVIELQLRGPTPRCGASRARAAQSEPKRRRKARKRRLWGSGKGRFRTRGRYSSATVRGTVWLVEDSCRSTTTRVKRGSVRVRNFKQRRTIVLRRGDRYVARR